MREEVLEAIDKGFLDPYDGYFIEGAFGMFTPQGARLVRSAVARLIDDANRIAKADGLTSRRQRIEAFAGAADIRKAANGGFYLETAGGYYAAGIAELVE